MVKQIFIPCILVAMLFSSYNANATFRIQLKSQLPTTPVLKNDEIPVVLFNNTIDHLMLLFYNITGQVNVKITEQYGTTEYYNIDSYVLQSVPWYISVEDWDLGDYVITVTTNSGTFTWEFALVDEED